MATLIEKKIQYAAIVAEFEEKRVSLDDWYAKYTLKEKLKAEIYEIETPLDQKIVDLRMEIAKAEVDLYNDNKELGKLYGSFNPHRNESDGRGGAALGPASAAPPPQVVLEEVIAEKTAKLSQKMAKLQSLVDQLPSVNDCARHNPGDDPAGLCHTARSDGMYSMYAPDCNGCIHGIPEI